MHNPATCNTREETYAGGTRKVGVAMHAEFEVSGVRFYSNCPRTKKEADRINEVIASILAAQPQPQAPA